MKENEVSEGFKDRATAKLDEVQFLVRGNGPSVLELREMQEAKKKANSGKTKTE